MKHQNMGVEPLFPEEFSVVLMYPLEHHPANPEPLSH